MLHLSDGTHFTLTLARSVTGKSAWQCVESTLCKKKLVLKEATNPMLVINFLFVSFFGGVGRRRSTL